MIITEPSALALLVTMRLVQAKVVEILAVIIKIRLSLRIGFFMVDHFL